MDQATPNPTRARLDEMKSELASQDRALTDVLHALGITDDDLCRCDLELDRATDDQFWDAMDLAPVRTTLSLPSTNFALLRA